MLGPHGELIAGSAAGRAVVLLERASHTGAPRAPRLGPDARSPAVLGDGTILWATSHELVALREERVLWTLAATAPITTPPVVLGSGGVAVGDRAGGVLAVDRAGAVLWRATLHEAITGIAPALLGRWVIITTHEGKVEMLDARRGTARWSRRLGAESAAAPIVAASGAIWVGAADGLHAYSFEGVERPVARIGEVAASPALGRHGSAIAVAGAALHAVGPDGVIRWRFELGARAAAAPATDVAGRAYVVTTDRRVLAIRDAGTRGVRLFEVELHDAPLGAPVVGPRGALYVATARGEVLELGAPLSGLGEALAPAGCTCAVASCTPLLDRCAAEPGCAAIERCARAHRCRGAACRLPDACAPVIERYGGVLGQSAVVAAGTDQCVRRACRSCT
ncbi:MAG: PQQ-binding-like beta-propeller repeat protein [Sorangiineae bacterium]|nr:PQQ-binding-like beta-propeller repeat protein [Polyangiaceae bacterium]MEB2322840.1 PQQ-binding-like beta-propeller repeat protein [Sorangiineae bacterium]